MGDARESASRRSRTPARLAGGALSLRLLALGTLLVIGAAAPVENSPRAQNERGAEPESIQAPTTASPTVYAHLQRVYEALEVKDYPAALSALGKVRRMEEKLSSYERSHMWQLYGFVYSGQERYERALYAFEQCVAAGGLPEEQLLQTRYNLGQLYIANEQYQRGIDTLESWIQDAGTPGPEGYFLIANGYVSLDDYDRALEWAVRGLDKTEEPREVWLALAVALYFEKKRYRESAELLEQLVTNFPEKHYWKPLAGVYGELGQEKKQLAVFELLYHQGLLTTSGDLVQMARLFLYHDAPYKAVVLLEAGLESRAIDGSPENRELLADAWSRASEHLLDEGDLHRRLAQLYARRAGAVEVCEVLRQVFRSDTLRDRSSALTLAGVAGCPIHAPAPARRLGPGDFPLPGGGSTERPSQPRG